MPTCPIHQTEMKVGERGEFFCSKFIGMGQPGTGAKGYCNQRIIAPGPGPMSRPGGGHGGGGRPPFDPTLQKKIAALNLAGNLCRGSNDLQAAEFAADWALAWLNR